VEESGLSSFLVSIPWRMPEDWRSFFNKHWLVGCAQGFECLEEPPKLLVEAHRPAALAASAAAEEAAVTAGNRCRRCRGLDIHYRRHHTGEGPSSTHRKCQTAAAASAGGVCNKPREAPSSS